MLVNQRVAEARRYRHLEARELARMAGLSAAEISHIERNLRTPKIETLQRIAAALDVTIGFLVGEDEDINLPLPEALARQSAKVFLLRNQISPQGRAYITRVLAGGSAPETVKEWNNLLKNVAEFGLGAFLIDKPELT